jgi:uroporphyrin-3 C-methyltransferase
VNEQLAKAEMDAQKSIEGLERQLQSTNSELLKEVRARETMHSEHQALRSLMQNISEKLGRSTVAWRMAEVEYLLTIANHRLTLAQDRETAIAVLKTADDRLKAIADPSLIKVREAIANELLALQAMPEVDIPGIALRVGSLVKSAEQFPLRDKKRLAVAMDEDKNNTPADWRQLPAAVWSDLKSLVQIRRHQQPIEPLLPPDQSRHLYQNLILKLEQARLAVLRHDTALFRQHLKEIESWVTNFFETESPTIVSTLAVINEMQNIELQPPVPDISGSLRLLREVMRERQPEMVVDSKRAIAK